MKFAFNLKSFLIFLLIFLVEVIIALFVKDSIIRPYGGDVLVVIMIYYFIKSFIAVKPLPTIIGVLLFAYAIEVAQYFRMVEVLGVQDNKALVVILGSSFSWYDMLAYTIGGAICYLIERNK